MTRKLRLSTGSSKKQRLQSGDSGWYQFMLRHYAWTVLPALLLAGSVAVWLGRSITTLSWKGSIKSPPSSNAEPQHRSSVTTNFSNSLQQPALYEQAAILDRLTRIEHLLQSHVTPTRTDSTDASTQSPTDSPTNAPTNSPTNAPTETPTNAPTNFTTNAPTETSTNAPTNAPTDSSTQHQQAQTPVFGFRVKVRFVADVDTAALSWPVPLYPLPLELS